MPRFILNELSTLEASLKQLIERVQHYQSALEKLQKAFAQANTALEYAQNERDRLHLECEALRSERHLLATRIENARHALQTTLGDLSHTGWVEPALHLLPVPDDENDSPTTTLVLSDSPDAPSEKTSGFFNQVESSSAESDISEAFEDISEDEFEDDFEDESEVTSKDKSDAPNAPNTREENA